MLRGIHKASSHWLGKVLMAGIFGFLALSFAIWGIGDIFRGFGRSTLAKVGSTEIGVEQFRQTYNERLQQLGRRLGRPITPDQARALGLERQALAQMIAEAAIDERARQLGLNLSDAEIARQITTDPNFLGPTGQFDRYRFDQMIRAAGYTEQRFAAEQHRVALRREIAGTISGGLTIPKTAADVLNRYQNEERAIEFVVLGQAKAGDIPEPTPEVIEKYFEERKALFRAPEYRKVSYLVVSAEDVAKSIEVSDADARRYYDDHRDRFGTPERRELQQIVFPKEEDARAAADRLAKGLSFAALAAERGLKDQDINLGVVAKSSLVDRAVADAAFALPQDGVSEPVASRFGTVLIHVVKIEPGNLKPYEQVAEEIRHTIALERARPALLDLRDKIEDDRAAGLHLDEIAKKLNLTVRTIDAVDRSGRDPDGKPVGDLPSGVDLVSNAFSSDVGVDNDPLQLQGGGSVWYDVMGITPSRDRSLDEVKDRVEARWRDDQVAERLSARTTEMLDKIKGGASFADVAASYGFKVDPLWGLKRGQASGPLSSQAVDAVFSTAKGAAGTAEGKDPTERIVFRVTDVTTPAFDPSSPQAQQHTETLRRSMSEDLLDQYITKLEQDLGTTINQDALRRAIGGETN